MKKILFAVKNMNIGGVEKSLISLLNTIDYSKYQVDLLLLEEYGGFMKMIPQDVNVIICKEYLEIQDELNLPPIYVIKKHIKKRHILKAIYLSKGYILTKINKNYKFYYKEVFKNMNKIDKHYDIAISYTSIINYLTWFVECYVKADKYIGWIHFDVSKLAMEEKLFLDLHKSMEKIFIVSQVALDSFVEKFPELKSKCELRYNVIDSQTIIEMAKERVESIKETGIKTIVTLGRMTSEKGQDIIPKVAKLLEDSNIHFKWYLIGDGSLSEKIINESKVLGVEDKVVLLGTKLNPYPYLKQADLYVQTSIHEGYCITLAEAKVFGMPIVSTEFAGAHEQLDNQAGCRVVERTVLELFNAIRESIKIN